MKTLILQLDIAWEDKPANHARVVEMLDAARPEPETLVVLPEMFDTGFSMNVPAIHDSETHETESFLRQLAADYHIKLVAGLVTLGSEGRGFNQCLVITPDGNEAARYSKLHPFTLGGESDNYHKGDDVVVVDCGEFKLSPFICYDLRFPEIFRRAVVRGANLFTVIANWPAVRVEHWTTLIRARAIENQAYVIGVNRSGSDPMLVYPGSSLIADPLGRVIAELGPGESSFSAEIDLESLLEIRKTLPFLADIREEFMTDGD
ncbi:MAG: carbon-nitrogen family hydrolase [Acidobacteriota bacterium]|nr:MAG: carbon-nitrogen family hydrolase [Acidobacteriota bacterium]